LLSTWRPQRSWDLLHSWLDKGFHELTQALRVLQQNRVRSQQFYSSFDLAFNRKCANCNAELQQFNHDKTRRIWWQGHSRRQACSTLPKLWQRWNFWHFWIHSTGLSFTDPKKKDYMSLLWSTKNR
jgi:hypothetical protein